MGHSSLWFVLMAFIYWVKKLKGMQQLLVCADGVQLLGEETEWDTAASGLC